MYIYTYICFSYTDISIQMPREEDIIKLDGITFPEDGKTQIFIPSKVLLDEINKG